MSLSSSSSLSVTIAHAISFLTRPLIVSYSATTIIKLQLILEANLTAFYAPSWVVKEPLRNSGRRCLTLSPHCIPPRAVYSACIATGVQWFDWIVLLGGREFDFFVDPGYISMRFGKKGIPETQLITIWADEVPSPVVPTRKSRAFACDESVIQAAIQAQQDARSAASKSLAQQLLEDDTEDDERLFAMIADEVKAPTWMTPVVAKFPVSIQSSSPLSSLSDHSRSSSRSSNSSSGFSFNSATSLSTATSVSNVSGKAEPKQSRRERARQARVFVDTTKTEVTPYDGGKTTVLTGGVMLGGAPTANRSKKAARPATASSDSWRAVRA